MAAPAFEIGSAVQGVELAPSRAIASIAAYQKSLEALQAALGVLLPGPGRQVTVDGATYLWSGPARWFVLAATDDADFATNLAARAQNFGSVTDQSDGRVVLRIHGPRVRDALAKLVPIDLHPSVFGPDATALTLAGHISVQIWQGEDGAYNLACFRSFAGDLFHALTLACREYIL
jgi:sarcosine oxidase subunit gamma